MRAGVLQSTTSGLAASLVALSEAVRTYSGLVEAAGRLKIPMRPVDSGPLGRQTVLQEIRTGGLRYRLRVTPPSWGPSILRVSLEQLAGGKTKDSVNLSGIRRISQLYPDDSRLYKFLTHALNSLADAGSPDVKRRVERGIEHFVHVKNRRLSDVYKDYKINNSSPEIAKATVDVLRRNTDSRSLGELSKLFDFLDGLAPSVGGGPLGLIYHSIALDKELHKELHKELQELRLQLIRRLLTKQKRGAEQQPENYYRLASRAIRIPTEIGLKLRGRPKEQARAVIPLLEQVEKDLSTVNL